ncbi:molecular chaperone TorD family protein [Ruegeria arenilitoris]|uniref:molecular chaperone TorD family protein n=1 Tax=Ruegeria arenilitoris TaxID=1173585 RepID=UPI00148018DF|nr:molecular chaperone TorD family protein [Ruegeria arenilitoris]
MTKHSPELIRFLSTMFARELDEATICACFDGVADALLSEVAGAHNLLDEMKTWSDPRKTKRDLAISYASLFLTGGKDSAPLYASAWQGDGALMSTPHSKMQSLLQQSGQEVALNFSEPADHLAIILEYLAMCLEQKPDTMDPAVFASEFILPWYKVFSAKVQSHRWVAPFYSYLVTLTEAFVVECAAAQTAKT